MATRLRSRRDAAKDGACVLVMAQAQAQALRDGGRIAVLKGRSPAVLMEVVGFAERERASRCV